MVPDPSRLTLTQAAEAIRAGRLTAEALAISLLQRIRSDEARVRAWVWLDQDRVLAQARNADRRRADSLRDAPLAGMPIGVKDIIDAAGIPTGMGSAAFRDHVPQRSATCVLRLEAAGAFVEGKTVTTEFANRRPGPTTNPWNARCTPGGSSSGSAAAVAACFTPAAIGSQTLGSTIRPAAYCGVVGFKPSFGLVSRHGVNPLSPTLDHVGLLARSIEDCALLLSCLAGFDPADPGSRADAGRAGLSPILQPLEHVPRLAAVRTPYWDQAEHYQQQHFEAICGWLRDRGALVVDVQLPPPFARANVIGSTIQAAEAAAGYRELRRAKGALIGPEFNALCDRGELIPADSYQEALEARTALQRAMGPLFDEFDAILTLSAPGEAPATLDFTGEPTFCSTWSVCGLPALALPTAFGPRGLPLGIQMVGADRCDQDLLRVAAWCAERLPRMPSPAGGAVQA